MVGWSWAPEFHEAAYGGRSGTEGAQRVRAGIRAERQEGGTQRKFSSQLWGTYPQLGILGSSNSSRSHLLSIFS